MEKRTTKWDGQVLALAGKEIKVGDSAPDATLVARDLTAKKLSDWDGQIKVLLAMPSMDTPVCQNQVRQFNKDARMFQCNKKPHRGARLFIFCGPLITVFSMLPVRSRSQPDRWLPARIRCSVRHCRDRRSPRRAKAAADPERGNRIFHRIPPFCGRKA